MAGFTEPIRCIRAAIDCLRAFEEFRASQPNGELTGLKLGVFAGPCYVVTANSTLDYFGQTVNCASRVQHLAESGEIVLEESAFAAVLMYRLSSFYLPPVWGYFALRWLERNRHL